MIRLVTFFIIFISVSSIAVSQEVGLECPERPADEELATALAGTWFSKGSRLAEKEKYEKAFIAFSCSLRMVEHPDTVFNAGQSARLGDNRNMALNMFRRYLAMAPEGHLASKSEKLIKEIEQEIKEEEQEARAQAEALRAAQEAQSEQPPVLEETVEPEDDDMDSSRALKIAGYITLGVGGASLVTGGVLQGLAGKARSDGQETNDYGEFQDLDDKMQTRQKVAIIGFVVGGVVMGTGITLLVLSGDGEDDTQVSLLPGPGGLVINGTF